MGNSFSGLLSYLAWLPLGLPTAVRAMKQKYQRWSLGLAELLLIVVGLAGQCSAVTTNVGPGL